MPTYEVTSPDGKTWEVNAPDGATQDQVLQYAKQQWQAQPKKTPAVVEAGSALRQIPRQLGLTARAGVNAVAAVPAMLADGLGGLYNTAADLVAGEGNGPRARPQMPLVNAALTRMGLPGPETPTERVAGDVAAMMGGAGGMAKASQVAARNAVGPIKAGLEQMAARPGIQVAGAAAAGGAGGSVREAGGGPWEQFLASLVGGVAGGAAAAKAVSAGNAVKAALTPQAVKMQDVDAKITLALQRSGLDWSQIPERVRQGVRAEVEAALRTGGELNAAALRRLIPFQATGTRPTVGQLTQDPGLITREANLAKTGANSTDQSLQTLPALQNRNTAQLLGLLDQAGASRNVRPQDAAGAAINSLSGRQAATESQISALYSQARDTSGRSLPLQGGTFTTRASQLIDEAMAGDSLPKAVENRLNAIATGNYPLTVSSAEAFKTRIGKLQRGTTDGNTRFALGLVRQALDETPLADTGRGANPGNLPAIPGTVPPSTAGAGAESIAAFNAARQANRQWMQTVEQNPALRAVVDGVEPDQFMQRFVIGKGASANEVRGLVDMLDPQARASVKDAFAKYLKDAATGGDNDIVKFGGKSFRNALKAVEDKLPALFNREEIQQFRDIAAVSKYMQAQPAGAAVNNSNSGALMLGRGLDLLDSASKYVPLGGRDILQGQIQGLQQRQVLAPSNALSIQPRQHGAPINPLMAALLAPSSVQSGQDDRRNKPPK